MPAIPFSPPPFLNSNSNNKKKPTNKINFNSRATLLKRNKTNIRNKIINVNNKFYVISIIIIFFIFYLPLTSY